jgi:hypothetical protein
MKMNNKIFSLLLLITIAAASCKPELKGELGDPSNKVAGMSGTWKVSQFSQIDLNNPVQEERDLTEFYVVEGQEVLTIVFNQEGRTYSVTPGAGRNFFGTAGTWAFDNDAAPSTLILTSDAETLELPLGAMVREFDNTFSIEIPRFCEDASGNRTNTVIYKFQFTRQ